MQSLAEHPVAAKQRVVMHQMVGRIHRAVRDEHEQLRREAQERDARRNQPITRGEVLDAIDQTIHDRGGNVGDHHEAVMAMLQALRSAFE